MGITKLPFNRLYGAKQRDLSEDEIDNLERTIRTLIDKFITSGAQNSWEKSEQDNEYVVSVDGIEVGEEA